jgi:hypothetical protein
MNAVPTKRILRTSAVKYRVFDIPDLELYTSLFDGLGEKHAVYELVPRSSPLSIKTGLYVIGRDLEYRIGDAESLPEDVKEAGRLVWRMCHEGEQIAKCHVHNDAVLFEYKSDIPELEKPADDYFAARLFHNIAGVEKVNGVWRPVMQHNSKEMRFWCPPNGNRISVPSTYNRFGFADETVDRLGKEDVIRDLMNLGLTEEQAKNEVSKDARGGDPFKDNQIVIIFSYYDDCSYFGPLAINMGVHPEFVENKIFGAFPARIID